MLICIYNENSVCTLRERRPIRNMILTLYKWCNFERQAACLFPEGTLQIWPCPLFSLHICQGAQAQATPSTLPDPVPGLHFVRLSPENSVTIPAWSVHGKRKTWGWPVIILCQSPRGEGTEPREWPSCSAPERESWESGMLKHRIKSQT